MNRSARRAANKRAFVATKASMETSVKDTKGWGPWVSVEVDPRAFNDYPNCARVRQVWRNRLFLVQAYDVATDWGLVDHLIIRHVSGRPVNLGWSILQRIKDELCSPESLAVQVLPRESQLVDQANCYHLWVLPEDKDLPFGLHLPGRGM